MRFNRSWYGWRGVCLVFLFIGASRGYGQVSFNHEPLTEQGDLSARMVEGIDRFLTRETDRIARRRAEEWHADFSSAQAFNDAMTSWRDLLGSRLGVVDARVTPSLEVLMD